MEDAEIVALYFARQEAAIAASQQCYGAYCYKIAMGVLANHEDAQETLSDTWLHAWNAIPPERPPRLRPFFAKITRNLAIDRWRRLHAQKRGSSLELALEELAECARGPPLPQQQLEDKELEQSIRRFLAACGQRERDVFLRRYFFFETTEQIARRYDIRQSNVLNLLSRTRKKLKAHLKKEGYLP